MSQPPQQPPGGYPPPGPEGQRPYPPPPQGPPMQGPPPPPPQGPPPQGPPPQGPPPGPPPPPPQAPPPSYGQQPYGNPGYAQQAPYAQQSPYGQQPYGAAPGYAGEAYGAPAYGAGPMGMPPLADAGKRFLARLIDGFIVAIPTGIIAGIVLAAMTAAAVQSATEAIESGQPAPPSGVGFGVGGYFLMFLIIFGGYFLYDWLMHSFAGGQTVGKKILKTRVVKLDGSPLTAGGVFARSAVFALPPIVLCVGSIFYLVNVLSLLWDKPYQQCYHDKAAKTVVVLAG